MTSCTNSFPYYKYLQQVNALMVRYVWMMLDWAILMLDEWNFVLTNSGVRCAVMTGMMLMLAWSANNSTTRNIVRRCSSALFVLVVTSLFFLSFLRCQLLFVWSWHRSGYCSLELFLQWLRVVHLQLPIQCRS